MSLKLIKEAQLATTISPDKLATYNVLKEAMGVNSLSALMEAFRPSPEDFAKWLEVIGGFAEEEGLSINQRSNFNDVASAVLDNDPANPPEEMRTAIINKLWNDHKAAKHLGKVEKLANAQEDEEAVRKAARSMMGKHRNSEDEEFDIFGASQGEEDQHKIPSAHQDGDDDDDNGTDNIVDHGDNQEDDMVGYYIVNNGRVVTGPFDDEEEAMQEMNDETTRGGDDSANEDKVLFGKADEDGYFIPDLDHEDEDSDEDGVDDDNYDNYNGDEECDDCNTRIGVPHNDRLALGPVVTGPGGGRSTEDEEKSVPRYFTSKHRAANEIDASSILHRAITTPREHISDALKNVENAGADAWKKHGTPKNPHPPKTMAHKAWEKGLKNAVKSQYGIEKNILVPPSRKR